MKQFIIALCMSLSTAFVHGQDDAHAALVAALADIDQLQGEFVQRQYTQADELLQESSGRFSLLKAGYFAWDIDTPDSQLIIADPEFLWQYDRDLETVTRRPVSSGGQMTPLQILGGDEEALRSGFDIVAQQDGNFILTPLAGDMGFQQLQLRLDAGKVLGMNILDNLDQRVVIEFSKLIINTDLSPADYAFAPPVDVDLFYYDE